MQRLLIFRHASAVPWGSTPDDFSRPLNEIGTAHARAMAQWMQENIELPELVLCSPSQRTRETLQPLIESASELERCTRFLPQIYDASVPTLINVLDHAFADCDSVMVVGHNPGLERIMYETIAMSEARTIRRLASGTVIVIELEPDWAEAQGQGKITHKMSGKKLTS